MQPILSPMPIKHLNYCAKICFCLCLGALLHPIVQAQPDTETLPSTASASIQSSTASSEAPLYESRTIRDQTLIADAAGEQAQWLDTEYGKLLVFYRPTETKKTRGVLILFHAAEDPQTWPPILENLRANLPRYGWETLAVTLPQQYQAPVPARQGSSSPSSTASATEPPGAEVPNTEATSVASASNSEASLQSSSTASSIVHRDTLIQAYVTATFEFIKKKGQFNAVLLVDNSSANPVLAQLLSQIKENTQDPATIDGPIQALVITNLQSQEALSSNELTAIFTNKQLPVLDVFFNPDDREQTKARDLHRAIAMRQKLDIYLQALLDSQPKIVETDPRSFLTARVRGFMQKHASGTEVQGNNGNKGDTENP